jgi:hypothetical protein
LAEGVGPVIGAGEQAEEEVGYAEGCNERVVGDGEVDAVEVVDEHPDGEQGGDVPALGEAGRRAVDLFGEDIAVRHHLRHDIRNSCGVLCCADSGRTFRSG